MVRRGDGELARYLEPDDHKVFGLGRAHPYRRERGNITEVLYTAYCHSGGNDPKMLQVTFSWLSLLR